MKSSKINLYIDNNAWDIFFDKQIDLLHELSEKEFSLRITPEVEIEIQHMPDNKLEYVKRILQRDRINVDRFFGFAGTPRAGGFGSLTDKTVGGRFISMPEREFIKSEKPKKKMRPTGLLKDETDTYLAARSLHSVVLTCNMKTSLKRVKVNHGGIVIDLKKFQEGESLSKFIMSELKKIETKSANQKIKRTS